MTYLSAEWMDEAVCREIGGDGWFPEQGHGWDSRQAIEVCQGCPVRRECLQYALGDRTLMGIWGGTTEKQRMQTRRAS